MALLLQVSIFVQMTREFTWPLVRNLIYSAVIIRIISRQIERHLYASLSHVIGVIEQRYKGRDLGLDLFHQIQRRQYKMWWSILRI